MRQTAPTITALLLAAHAIITPARAHEDPPQVPAADRQEYLDGYGLLAETVAQIELNHAAPVERRRLFEAALRGMMAELDPYSAYLPPEQFSKLTKLAEQNRATVGLELAIEEGRMVVLGVHEGSPAQAAGILPGERVVAINGVEAKSLSLAEADERLLPAGQSVTVRLRDADDSQRDITLIASRESKPTVVGVRVIDVPQEPIGYVRLTSFSGDTANELRRALENLKQQGATALVLDLRFNPGGLLEGAVDVADLVLDKGPIVSVAGRHGDPRVYQAGKEDVTGGLPIALLVNRYSASASEVVAAALQDNQRAEVVGERTWGKGSVQNVIPLGDGKSGLKLTTASYVRPNGHNIHRFAGAKESDEWGVSPNEGMALALTAQEATALLNSWKQTKDTPPLDRQLELAIEELK